jgi:type IV pilus assembly protein PilA
MSGKSNISKYFLSLVSFGTQAGFTLIELMVVVVMVGVLVAIGLPNVLSQAGKAREASAKNALSAIAMAQQAYFFERAEFANSLSALDLSPNITYYTITEPVLPSSTAVRHEAHGENSEQNNIRNYGVGIYYINRGYKVILCQSLNPTTFTQAPDDSTGFCSNGGTDLQ